MFSGLTAVANAVNASLTDFSREHEVGEREKVLRAARMLPWKTLGEQFSILEDELRERILKVAANEQNFTPERAQARRRPGNILPGCLPMATASLEADPVLHDLRFKLVPARLSEEDFWRCYFWCVAPMTAPSAARAVTSGLALCQARGQHQVRAAQRLCDGQHHEAGGRPGRRGRAQWGRAGVACASGGRRC